MALPTPSAITVPPAFLTTQDEMTLQISKYAADILNETIVQNPNMWNYAIATASDDVLFYLQKRATAELLAGNRWARQKATILACWHFSGFAGEPHNAAFEVEKDTAIEQMTMVMDGKADIPGIVYGTEDNKGSVPVGSNLSVDMQRLPVIRVVRPATTGRPAGYPVTYDVPTSYPRPATYG